MQITINVPDQYLLNYTPYEIAKNLKLCTALLMFQTGQISAGAACEFAEVDRYTFMAACKLHNIAVIAYDEDDIQTDVDGLIRSHHKC